MEFLQELYNLVPATAGKKKKTAGIGMVPLNSFISGVRPKEDDDKDCEVAEEGDKGNKFVLPDQKPRNKALSDARNNRKAGVHDKYKGEYSRSKEKDNLRKVLSGKDVD